MPAVGREASDVIDWLGGGKSVSNAPAADNLFGDVTVVDEVLLKLSIVHMQKGAGWGW